MIKTYDYQEEVSNTYFKATEKVSLSDLQEGDYMLIETKVAGSKQDETSTRYAKFMGSTEKFFYQVDYCDGSFENNKKEARVLSEIVVAKDAAFSKRKRTAIDRVISVKKVKAETRQDVMTYRTSDMYLAIKKQKEWDAR